MKCIEINQNILRLTERDRPKPKKGEILIKIHAAGVNRPDILQKEGKYNPPEGVSDIPGLEVAGEIVEFGKRSRGKGIKVFRKNEKILALLAGGGYAEYCVVPAEQCLPIPKGMDFVTAAGIPETFFTVWSNLVDIANLKKGETLLIHSGASGIGTVAIQIAKYIGAKVFVTASSGIKCTACKKIGANFAVNYKDKDFVEEILKETRDQGVDVILDMAGGDFFAMNLKILKEGGRHVSIGLQRGNDAKLNIFRMMSKQLTITGSTLRNSTIEEKFKITKSLYKNIWPLLKKRNAFTSIFSKKRIAPIIDKTFLLEEAESAHEYLDMRAHIGKVILKIL